MSTPVDKDFSDSYKRFALIMLCIVYALNFLDRQLLVILQEPIKLEMGLSDAQLGLLSGFTFAVVYVGAGIPIAYLADRYNRRNIIAISLSVWSGMTAVSGFVQNYAQLVLARIGVGLGEAGGSPPAHSMISDYFPPEKRGTALSVYSMGVYIGVIVGFSLGGLLAEKFGWRQAFLIIGIPGVLFAVFFRLTIKEPLRGRWDPKPINQEKPTFKETLKCLYDRKAFWLIAFACAMNAYVGYGSGNFFPSYFMRNHDMSITQVGMVLAIAWGVAGAIGTFMGGYLCDRLGVKDKRWYLWLPMYFGLAAYPLFTVSLLLENTMGTIVCLVAANIMATTYLGPSIAMSHGLVSPTMRAMTSALLFFILNMVGLGIGPFMTGLQSDLLEPVFGNDSLKYSMLITVQFGYLSVLLFFLASRRLLIDIEAEAKQTQASS